MDIKELVQKAKKAATIFRSCSEAQRVAAIKSIADALRRESAAIIAANQLDLANAKGLSLALIDRLVLNEARIEEMACTCEKIAEQEQVVGATFESHTRDDGLQVARERIPIGLIGIIFESRPNVVVDCSALALKSGNAVVLKGGKEARHSNQILGELIQQAIAKIVPKDVIQVLDSRGRKALGELLLMREDIDLIIPRGGEGLIQFVYEHSKIPVIAHFKGLCHIYVHRDANLSDAQNICINAKVQRPGVCNAMETLLVHRDLYDTFLPNLIGSLQKSGIEVRGDHMVQKIDPKVKAAKAEDWDTEYLDKILAIRLVQDEDEAIAHIQKHGSHHTEAILASDSGVIQKFKESIDASCIAVNASTRFNDGGQLGLGAELGISTTKLHAYGPMGAKEMTSLRFVVNGKGHIRT